MTVTVHWQERVGNQRDWVWRGWKTRYTYIRPTQATANTTPLMLLHGFGASIGHWRQNLEIIGDRHTVYALDMLGFGASEKAAAPYSVNLWVEQVYEFWQIFIGQPVILIGNSLGSLVSLAAAAAHPDMVQAVVMMSLPDPTLEQEAIPPFLKPVVAGIKSLVVSPLLLKPLFGVLRRPGILRKWAATAYANPEAVTNEVIEIFTTPTQDRNSIRAFIALCKASTGANYSPSVKLLLPNIEIPMLLMWGSKDLWVPPSLATKFAQLNANIQLINIENAGHCPHDERPEEINQLILDWIEQYLTQTKSITIKSSLLVSSAESDARKCL